MRKNESGSRNYDWLDSSQLKIRKCFEEKKEMLYLCTQRAGKMHRLPLMMIKYIERIYEEKSEYK